MCTDAIVKMFWKNTRERAFWKDKARMCRLTTLQVRYIKRAIKKIFGKRIYLGAAALMLSPHGILSRASEHLTASLARNRERGERKYFLTHFHNSLFFLRNPLNFVYFYEPFVLLLLYAEEAWYI